MGQERTRNHGVMGTVEEQKWGDQRGDMEWNGGHGVVTTKEKHCQCWDFRTESRSSVHVPDPYIYSTIK
jgi:hypothetical protein